MTRRVIPLVIALIAALSNAAPLAGQITGCNGEKIDGGNDVQIRFKDGQSVRGELKRWDPQSVTILLKNINFEWDFKISSGIT